MLEITFYDFYHDPDPPYKVQFSNAGNISVDPKEVIYVSINKYHQIYFQTKADTQGSGMHLYYKSEGEEMLFRDIYICLRDGKDGKIDIEGVCLHL